MTVRSWRSDFFLSSLMMSDVWITMQHVGEYMAAEFFYTPNHRGHMIHSFCLKNCEHPLALRLRVHAYHSQVRSAVGMRVTLSNWSNAFFDDAVNLFVLFWSCSSCIVP